MAPHQHPRHPFGQRGFTLIEIMIAILVMAVGISAAIGAIANNDYRKSLDESALADLVLRQMAARLKTTSMSQLGRVYVTPANRVQGWTLHLRATASTRVAAADPAAPALIQPYAGSAAYVPPSPLLPFFRPLTQQDLIDAGILREQVGLQGLNVYVEYYNLNTVTGLQNVGGMLVPSESGLIRRYNELQDADPTGSPRRAWWSLVGDPDPSHRSPAAPLSPTDVRADAIIMPATFSVTEVDQPGVPEQVLGAFNHGLAIRILVSWQPGALLSPTSTHRSWRETVIVKRD